MLRRENLTDTGDGNFQNRVREMVRCRDCGAMSSRTRGDFWYMPMDEVLQCGNCGSDNLALVISHVINEVVKG